MRRIKVMCRNTKEQFYNIIYVLEEPLDFFRIFFKDFLYRRIVNYDNFEEKYWGRTNIQSF